MTLTIQIPRVDYVGTGAQTVFSFSFRLINNSDLRVFVDDIQQVEGVDYTIQGLTQAGGDVVFFAAPGIGLSVVLRRVTSRDQQIDYEPFDAFPADTHEFGLDKLTMIVQELEVTVNSGDALNDHIGDFNNPHHTTWTNLEGDHSTVLDPFYVKKTGDTMTGSLLLDVAPDVFSGIAIVPTAALADGDLVGYTLFNELGEAALSMASVQIGTTQFQGFFFGEVTGVPAIRTSAFGNITLQNWVFDRQDINTNIFYMPVERPTAPSFLYFNQDGTSGWSPIPSIVEETDSSADVVIVAKDALYDDIGISLVVVSALLDAADVAVGITVSAGSRDGNNLEVRLLIDGTPDPDTRQSFIPANTEARYVLLWSNVAFAAAETVTVEVRALSLGPQDSTPVVEGATEASVLTIRQVV